jgi:hypothetical protein
MCRRGVLRKLLAVSLVAAALVVPSTVSSATNDGCTRGDVQALTVATPQHFNHAFGRGITGGVNGAALNCQFRLYDDNDEDNPEVPHVFTDEDWFLAGVLQWVTRDDLDFFDVSRAEGIEFLESVEDRFFWGPEGTILVEIPLTQTAYRNDSDMNFLGWMVLNQRYHIFEPGSVSPGVYEWRWETVNPFDPLFVAQGKVQIVDS